MRVAVASSSPEPEPPPVLRQVEFRFARPTPRLRYEKGGKVTKEDGPDMSRVLRAAEGPLTRAVQAVYGPETAVLLSVGVTGDIRLSGNFGVKVSDTRAVLSDLLTQTLEHLEVPEE